jgi:hypothetical protein
MECPRRAELGMSAVLVDELRGPDTYREDNTCSYCGSLNPETLMERLEIGNVKLTPTDKSYKVYVQNDGGEGFKQTYRNCPDDVPRHGPKECTHWVTRDMTETKFYFQHLSVDQRKRFVELLNDKKLKLNIPGYFYVLPFFCARQESKEV